MVRSIPGKVERYPLKISGDKLSHLPASFSVIADTPNAPFAGIVHDTKPYYGIQ